MEVPELHFYFLKSSGASIDTRTILPGQIFFALQGEHFDGHQFVDDALKKGSSRVVVQKDKIYPKNKKIVQVDNVLECLQQLAKYHRVYCDTMLIAITGSNGKTTTKELIHSILGTKYQVLATSGNLNNHIGVPLTLLQLTSEIEIGVIEMGASAIGEIEFLCRLAKPNFGYITNFGRAHLEGFKSISGVIKGKQELYEYLTKNNQSVLFNLDDPIQSEYACKVKNYLSFGSVNKTSNWTFNYLVNPRTFKISIQNNGFTYRTNLYGSYNFSNVGAGIAVGLTFDISPKMIQIGLEKYHSRNNRSQQVNLNGIELILDAYNANPDSMHQALNFFLKIDQKNSGVILGDMLELGKYQDLEHKAIIEVCRKSDLKFIFLVGEIFYNQKVVDPRIKTFKSLDDLKDALKQIMKLHDIRHILIKGSRKIALERVLEGFPTNDLD